MNRRDLLCSPTLSLALPAGTAFSSAPAASKPRILAISAHPADFCSRAGGTLIQHVRDGCQAKVIWLTHGETEESGFLLKQRPGIAVEEVRRIREKEAFACAGVIGAEGHMFGWGDNPLRVTPERMEALVRQIADFKPNILLTHWKDELTYPTHWRTAQTVIQAAQMAGGSWDIRFFEPNIGSAAQVGFVPDHYIDIGAVFERKIEALKTLAAQPNLVENYTACGRWRGLEIRRRYAEGFVRWMPKPTVLEKLDG